MKKDDVPQAVAIKYPEGCPAPFICAKTKGELAEKMVQIARENNIPVEENQELTDILMMEEIGSLIPENTWEVMAMIFSYLVDFEKK